MQSAFRRVRRKFRIYAGTLRFTISSCLNRPIVGPTPPKLPGLASNLRHHRVALLLTGAYIDYRIFAPMSRGKREIFIFRRIFLKKHFSPLIRRTKSLPLSKGKVDYRASDKTDEVQMRRISVHRLA